MAKTSLIIDTNVYISFLINKGNSAIQAILEDTNMEIIVSEKLIWELKDTIHKRKFNKLFNFSLANEFIAALKERATSMAPTTEVTICRDPKDNFLLALAKDAGADFLITGDKDLLVLQQFENTRIITLAEFAGRHL